MQLDVAFVPADARRWRNTVCILIDVLRATSTIVTLCERGCRAVIPMRSVAGARRLGRAHGYLLVGERGALAPPGFAFDNSPATLARADLAGQTAVLTTGNGTAALRWLSEARAVLAGCLLNATACCQVALALARTRHADLGIVCAGRARRFALDDAVCGGFMAGQLSGMASISVTDAALAARALWERYNADPGGVMQAFRASGSGRRLQEVEKEEDVVFCARIDASRMVPALVAGDPPRFVAYTGEESSWTG